MCRRADIGTPANASWRATPLPQSMTYAVSFATTTCAGAELALRGRGPPPVPSRISLVPTLYAPSERRNVVTISAERSGGAAGGAGPLQPAVGQPDRAPKKSSLAALLDYLVGAPEDRRWDRQPERTRGLQIDDELELGRLLDWQLGRSGPLEDLVDVHGGAPPLVVHIRRIAHQAADHHVVPVSECGRQPMLQCEVGQKAGVIATGLRGRVNENGADATLRHRREGSVVIRDGAHAD